MDNNLLGQRIREQRTKRNLTLTALAKAAGISPAYLSDIEYGRAMPKVRVFVGIANALELSADDLLDDALHVNQTKVFDELIDALQRLDAEQKHLANAVLKTYLKYVFVTCQNERANRKR